MTLKERAGQERKRTITWEDPRTNPKPGVDLSGFEYLCKIKEGKIPPPPAARLVGYRIVEVKEGLAVFEFAPAECHYNPFSTVHGGLITTLLDTSMTAAVMTTLSRGQQCSTIEIKTHFIRPISDGTGLVRAKGSLIHFGSRIAVAQGTVEDARGRQYAHATSTCLIISAPVPRHGS